MREHQLQELVEHLSAISTPAKPDIRDKWYQRSYHVLAKDEKWKSTPDGLVRIIAYAGSWVNVIPGACPSDKQEDVDQLLGALDSLDTKATKSKRRRVLKLARIAFGIKAESETVILLSKALHFLRPARVPMIDRRVGSAWETLADNFAWLQPKSILSGKGKESKPRQADYLAYWDVADRLVRHRKKVMPSFDYRELDTILFGYGKAIAARKGRRL